ncbi:MAG: ATP-binding protein, partial [Gaiellales bacterium]
GGALGSTEETIWAVRRFLEVLARDRPLVVIFEDIHWAEPTFLDLIERVAQWARDAPITLVCLARNELLDVRPSWGGGLFNATSILLEPLSQGEADELIDHLLGDIRMLPDTRRRVAAIAEGNPLFMEQFLSSLGEGEEASDLTAPASVQAVIAARLDRLDEPERTLLECASLVGKEFRADEVLELAGISDGSDARGALQTLVGKDLIRPARSVFHGDSAFRFRHILIRDAAYGRIPKVRRSQLHERLAEHVDRTSGQTGAELEEIIGYHYEQAYRLRAELGPLDTASAQLAARAGERLGHAGRRALNRGDTPAATALLERAVEVLVPAQAERLECMLDLATAASWAGDYDRATTILDDTLAAAAAAGDRRVEARALVGRAHLQQVRSESSEEPVTATCEAAIPVFERAGDNRGLAEAFLRIGHAHMRRGHYGRATQVLERALEHALRLDMTPERVTILGNLALALWIGPVPADEAVSRTREIIARAAALHPLAAFNATVPLALLQASRGRIADARRLLAHVQATADEVKVPETIGFVSYYIGLVELLAGDVSAAEGDLRTSVALFQSQTGRTGLADAASALAQCLLGRGAVDEASALAELSRASATGLDTGDEVGWRIAIARTRARAGDADLALGIAQEAVAWAHQTDSPLLQGDALIALAEAHRSSRDAAAAGVAIDEALICYERKGAAVAARRARAMRRTLGRQIARRGGPR